jgi:hypothetical protein
MNQTLEYSTQPAPWLTKTPQSTVNLNQGQAVVHNLAPKIPSVVAGARTQAMKAKAATQMVANRSPSLEPCCSSAPAWQALALRYCTAAAATATNQRPYSHDKLQTTI